MPISRGKFVWGDGVLGAGFEARYRSVREALNGEDLGLLKAAFASEGLGRGRILLVDEVGRENVRGVGIGVSSTAGAGGPDCGWLCRSG